MHCSLRSSHELAYLLLLSVFGCAVADVDDGNGETAGGAGGSGGSSSAVVGTGGTSSADGGSSSADGGSSSADGGSSSADGGSSSTGGDSGTGGSSTGGGSSSTADPATCLVDWATNTTMTCESACAELVDCWLALDCGPTDDCTTNANDGECHTNNISGGHAGTITEGSAVFDELCK